MRKLVICILTAALALAASAGVAAAHPGRLAALQTRIDRANLVRDGVAVTMTGLDPRRGRVVVGVAHPTPALRAALRRRYGRAVLAIRAPALAPVSQVGPLVVPFGAGLELEDPTSGLACTSGFIVQRGSSSFLLTAGHCGRVGDQWRHGGLQPVGSEVADSLRNRSDADAALVSIPGLESSNRVYLAGGGQRTISAQQRRTADRGGQRVCSVGLATPYRCGRLRFTNVTVHYIGTSITLYHQRYANLRSRAGDSGSPIFHGHTAIGVLTATDGHGHSTYSQISRVTAHFGVTVTRTAGPLG